MVKDNILIPAQILVKIVSLDVYIVQPGMIVWSAIPASGVTRIRMVKENVNHAMKVVQYARRGYAHPAKKVGI